MKLLTKYLFFAVLFAVGMVFCAPENGSAQGPLSLPAVKDYPWYDREKGRPRFIPPAPEKKPVEWKFPDWLAKTPSLKYLFYAAATLLLLMLAALLFWLIRRFFSDTDFSRLMREKAIKEKKRRIEALAPEAEAMFDRLFEAAEEAFAAGEYRSAIIYFFSGVLVELDKARAIRLQKGRTDHDFDRQLQKQPTLRTLYRRPMLLFEEGYYGNHEVTHEAMAQILPIKEQLYAELSRLKALAEERRRIAPPVLPYHKLPMLLLAALVLFSITGCRSKYWDKDYTDYLPESFFDKSINGNSEFRERCQEAGGRITSAAHLTRRAEKYDVILWFPNKGFPITTLEQRQVKWYTDWLVKRPGRVFVVVADGWRADVDYWQSVEPFAPESQKAWVKKQLDEALEYRPFSFDEMIQKAKEEAEKKESISPSDDLPDTIAKTPEENSLEENAPKENSDGKISDGEEAEASLWFALKTQDDPLEKSGLAGEFLPETFSEPQGYQARLLRTLRPLDGSETILTVGEEPLILHRKVGESEVYIVHSGFFLLNGPIMKPENRLLADALLDRIQPKDRKILFLTGSGVPSIPRDRKEEPVSRFSLGQLSTFSIFVWQLLFLTLALFLGRWPISGRPKMIPRERLANFGRHLDALGDLLEKTGDTAWAERELSTPPNARSDQP